MPALANYGGVLESWAQAMTDELGLKFEAWAGRYRAETERMIDGGVIPDAEVRAIEEDLRVLGGNA